MEQENKVSIWLTAFDSAGELAEFVRETFTLDGSLFSPFMKAFAIDFIDQQFCEVLFAGDQLREALNSFSYAAAFIDRVDADCGGYTGAIAVYNFNYSGKIITSGHIHFAGVFDYRRICVSMAESGR